MNQSRIPRERELYNLVLQALHAFGGSATNSKIFEWVENQLDLTDEQLSELRNSANSDNDTKIRHHIRFALTHLRLAGFLDNPRRSFWKLRDEAWTKEDVDPDEVIRIKETNPESQQGISWRNLRRQSSAEILPSKAEVLKDTVTNTGVLAPTYKSDTPNATHDEIQWKLLSLGSEMKLDLWVASNDRNKSFQGNVFSEIPRLRSHLPVQFDQRTQRIVELIDVLWLQGNSIIAAFEIEHTTSVFSGLLRMSDLIALQPNLNINLFIVAPDVRREKVKSEINRPTFAKLNLPKRCRYIAYSRLTQKIDQATRGGFLRHLSPSILNELAEVMDKKSNSPTL